MNNQDIKIKCDECEYEFFLSDVKINEAIVELNNTHVALVFYTCPKCKKIYRVSIQDRRYYDLAEDLEKTKKRIRKNRGSNNVDLARMLTGALKMKEQRLKAHVDKVNKMFPGTFIFEESDNNTTIKYLP